MARKKSEGKPATTATENAAPNARLSADDVVEIRRAYAEDRTDVATIARHFRVTQATVSTLITGSTWKRDPATKAVRLDLPADVHRLLRLVSAHADQSMSSYAREALGKALRDEAKRRGIKP